MSIDATNDIELELKTQYELNMRYLTPVPWLQCYQLEIASVYVGLQMVRTLNRNHPMKHSGTCEVSHENRA